MVKCHFTTKYWNFEFNKEIDFYCEEKDILKSGLCIFHDKNYLQDKASGGRNEQNVLDKLMPKIHENVKGQKPLLCIGYYLPSIKINENFIMAAYFSKCKFQGFADFSASTFWGTSFADAEFSANTFFHYAKFIDYANFNSATFLGIADFPFATFSGRATFNKAKFFGDYVNFRQATFSNIADFMYGRFSKHAYFELARFLGPAYFFEATFSGPSYFFKDTFAKEANYGSAVFAEEADFTKADFMDEVNFDNSIFPSPKTSKEEKEVASNSDYFIKLVPEDAEKIVIVDNKGSYVRIEDFRPLTKQDFHDKSVPIKFDYCTFRKRVRFIGKTEKPLQLGLVSFKGIDLSNIEFHNVEWQKTKDLIFITRLIIVDEKALDKNSNYEEVSKIYNQLRKNYESKLLFNEASNFFIGEMEAIRKSLLKGSGREKISSIPYSLYKGLALYGESYFLPLIVWTPAIILLFLLLRVQLEVCSVQPVHVAFVPYSQCSMMDKIVDSFAAYFQFPRSSTNIYDTIERIVSIPIRGTAFIAIRRKFERRK